MSNVLGGKYIIWPLIWVHVTWNVAQYLLLYVTYSAAKFETATSNGLRGDAFTWKNTLFDLNLGHTRWCQVTSTLCDLFRYKVWSFYIWRFEGDALTKKNTLFDFCPWIWVKVTWNVISNLNLRLPNQLQSLKLLRLTVLEIMHLQKKYIIWPLTLSHEMLPRTIYF